MHSGPRGQDRPPEVRPVRNGTRNEVRDRRSPREREGVENLRLPQKEPVVRDGETSSGTEGKATGGGLKRSNINKVL